MNEPPCILIADDEAIGREVLGEMLLSQGYHLVYARNGLQALEIVDQIAIDLILLDVMMPDVDGFEICRRLKANPERRQIPVILVTALDDKSDLARGLDAGADDFLSKPVHSVELRARVRSMLRLKEQYDKLQETLTLREDMAHMLVHDMRTPLAAILGLSELLQSDEVDLSPAELQEDMQTIHSQAARLNLYVNDMLMLAKMSSGEFILNRAWVALQELVELVIESHSVSARLKRIRFRIEAAKLEPAFVDAALFQRVLDNLVANAMKFSPVDGVITVRLEPTGVGNGSSARSTFRCKIIDQGPGVAPEHRELIFDKFKVVALKKKASFQFGLGLAFCKMVIDAHGGRIFVENDPGHGGAVFVIEL